MKICVIISMALGTTLYSGENPRPWYTMTEDVPPMYRLPDMQGLTREQTTPRVKIETEHTINLGLDGKTVGMVLGSVLFVYSCFAVYNFLKNTTHKLTDNCEYKIARLKEKYCQLKEIESLIEQTKSRMQAGAVTESYSALQEILAHLDKRRLVLLEAIKKLAEKNIDEMRK